MVAIFVVLTILLFILIDIAVLKYKEKTRIEQTNHSNSAIEEFKIPFGLFFYPGHTWMNILPSGNVNIGIDDFAVKLIGKIDKIDCQKPGKSIQQGKPVLTIHQGKRVMTFESPVDGFIKEINHSVINHPEKLLNHPYSTGWVYQIQPSRLSGNLTRLMVAEKSIAWLKSEVYRFREFFKSQAVTVTPIGQTLQDGGMPVQGLLEHVDEKTWTKFQDTFLTK